MKKTFVITNKGQILVQIPDDNQYGFSLSSDDQTWAGGFGIATDWEVIESNDPRITQEDHDQLDWLLE